MFLAKSRPIVLISIADGSPHCGASIATTHFGTQMPGAGAIHPICFPPIRDVGDPLQSNGMILRVLAVAALFAWGGPPAAQGRSPGALPFVLKQVGPGAYAAMDGPEHKAGSNAGFVIGDDGVLVVDAFFTPDAARALVAEIRRLTPKPIRYVVNTHYHADHTGGDQLLRDARAGIIAHKKVPGGGGAKKIKMF